MGRASQERSKGFLWCVSGLESWECEGGSEEEGREQRRSWGPGQLKRKGEVLAERQWRSSVGGRERQG